MDSPRHASWWRAGRPWGVLLALLAGACIAPKRATFRQLQTRAAFDLGCPPQQLQVYPLDARTRGVVGCGRRLAYVEICEERTGTAACTWLLDSPPAGPAASAPCPHASPCPTGALGVQPAPASNQPPILEPAGAPAVGPGEVPAAPPTQRPPIRDFGF